MQKDKPKKIKFGTDGWRGIIARDFTFDNLELVTQAVADYVKNHDIAGRGVVVGYDNRFLSEQFAAAVADVLNDNGIPVYITKQPTPTPVTAFAVKQHNAAGAVMLTASHNPPEYNGFKFIPEYAGPALPHITKEIEDNIHRLQAGDGGADWTAGFGIGYSDQEAALELLERTTLEKAGSTSRAQRVEIDPMPAYLEHIARVINMDTIKKAGLKIIVDPMYGAGIGCLDGVLRDAGAQVETIHSTRDPLFGGSLPEPTGKSLTELRNLVLQKKANLGLALDGDADRFGIIDADGQYIAPNQFLPMLLYHLLKVRGWRGPVSRTVATTHLMDIMAAKYDLPVEETAVGFKYIGQCLWEKGCIMGGEESGGVSIKGHIPEKDGILAGLLAAEMVAHHGKSLGALMEQVWSEFGRMHSERVDVHTSAEDKERVLKALQDLAPQKFAGQEVVNRITLDGIKLVLADGSWVLVRASGTEPLFRIYAEAGNMERMKAIQQEMRGLLSI